MEDIRGLFFQGFDQSKTTSQAKEDGLDFPSRIYFTTNGDIVLNGKEYGGKINAIKYNDVTLEVQTDPESGVRFVNVPMDGRIMPITLADGAWAYGDGLPLNFDTKGGTYMRYYKGEPTGVGRTMLVRYTGAITPVGEPIGADIEDKAIVAVPFADGRNKFYVWTGSEYEEFSVVMAYAKNAIPSTQKGVANGVATLGGDGKVPSGQLPSYVDDVEEYQSITLFPEAGEAGKIYVAKDTNKTYRWSGTMYVEISASLALGFTNSTAFPGDRGVALEHALTDAERATAEAYNGLDSRIRELEGGLDILEQMLRDFDDALMRMGEAIASKPDVINLAETDLFEIPDSGVYVYNESIPDARIVVDNSGAVKGNGERCEYLVFRIKYDTTTVRPANDNDFIAYERRHTDGEDEAPRWALYEKYGSPGALPAVFAEAYGLNLATESKAGLMSANDKKAVAKIAGKADVIEIMDYIGVANKILPKSGVYTYDGVITSHYRILYSETIDDHDTGCNFFVFCPSTDETVNDGVEADIYEVFKEVEGGYSYYDQFGGPDTPIAIRRAFGVAPVIADGFNAEGLPDGKGIKGLMTGTDKAYLNAIIEAMTWH